jgi:cell wall-associated NlpC family hydrolase
LLFKKLFPYTLAACFALGTLPLSAAAQTGETRQRQVAHATKTLELSPLDADDPVIVSEASPEEIRASKPTITSPTSAARSGSNPQFQHLMMAAIDQRLGSPYHWGSEGPNSFDCSGFVWSTFQSVGIDFERGSARTLWGRFAAPEAGEQYKFGTLVFFSNLAHVGIVADEHGFYHASRHHGVVYSPFNDYWLARIDGFRKVPMATPLTTD